MITKRYDKDFFSSGGALTLRVREVSEEQVTHGVHERTHSDGWTIKGEIKEDFFTWVNYFEANHPIYGRVWGDFEKEVHADSEEGFQHFYKHHEPEAWDYADI